MSDTDYVEPGRQNNRIAAMIAAKNARAQQDRVPWASAPAPAEVPQTFTELKPGDVIR